MAAGLISDRAQNPFTEKRGRQLSCLTAQVAHLEPIDLDRVIDRHKQQQLLTQTVAGSLENRVALAVPDAARCQGSGGGLAFGAAFFIAQEQRRGRPILAAPFIAEIQDFTGRIGHGVIVPRRQPIALAIAGPGVAAASLGNQETERRIGDDINPRRRRQRPRLDFDPIARGRV